MSDFQGRSSRSGAEAEATWRRICESQGWKPQIGHKIDGVQIDVVTMTPHIRFEVKAGDIEGPRPGLIRTDNVRKALHSAYHLHFSAGVPRVPFVIVTNALCRGGNGERWIDVAKQVGVLTDIVCMYDHADLHRFIRAVSEWPAAPVADVLPFWPA